jgi:DnaK suppressor protein
MKRNASSKPQAARTDTVRSEMLRRTEATLVARRDAMRRTLAGDERMLKTLHESGVSDEGDAALVTEQAELNSQMASFESRELAQIDAALQKIRSGQYGRCETCGKAIAPIRLKALPYATECIVCARNDERQSGPSRAGYAPVNRIAALAADDDAEPSLDDAAFEESR